MITAPNQISCSPDQALGMGGRVGAEHFIPDFVEIKAFERSESSKIVPQVPESWVHCPSFFGQCLCWGWTGLPGGASGHVCLFSVTPAMPQIPQMAASAAIEGTRPRCVLASRGFPTRLRGRRHQKICKNYPIKPQAQNQAPSKSPQIRISGPDLGGRGGDLAKCESMKKSAFMPMRQ